MRLRAMAAAAVLGSAAVLVAAGPVAAKGNPIDDLTDAASPAEACHLLLGDDAFTEAASEGKVAPGDPFAVDVTWGSTGWDPAPVQVVGCTALDGKFLAGPSTRALKEDNDGLYVHEFAVPQAASNGSVICEEGVVIGLSSAGQPRAESSGADCFTVVVASSSTPAPAAPRQAATVTPPSAATKQQLVAAPAPPVPSAPAPSAAAPDSLPRTGTGTGGRALATLAGFLFVLGGVAVASSRPSAVAE